MANILVILAHPNFTQSQINRKLIDAIKQVPNVTINDIYDIYPDGIINIDVEQKKIEQADVIVFQHPFYWYSAPALLKEWIDLVLQYNYAYGPKGKVLAGKKWLSVVSTGSAESTYQKDGLNKFTVRQLMAPFEQTANLCNMVFIPPIVAYCARTLTADDSKLSEITKLYSTSLLRLVQPDTDLGSILQLDTLNEMTRG